MSRVLSTPTPHAAFCTLAQAATRLSEVGPNAIREGIARGPLAMLFAQFTDFMILVLIAAAIVAGVVGEPQDAISIVVIVVLNAIIGFAQENRAEKAVARSRRSRLPRLACAATGCRGRRSGRPCARRRGGARSGEPRARGLADRRGRPVADRRVGAYRRVATGGQDQSTHCPRICRSRSAGTWPSKARWSPRVAALHW